MQPVPQFMFSSSPHFILFRTCCTSVENVPQVGAFVVIIACVVVSVVVVVVVVVVVTNLKFCVQVIAIFENLFTLDSSLLFEQVD